MTKREAFSLLAGEASGIVCVRFFAPHPDVQVPAAFKEDAALILHVGYSLPRPIVDLCVDDWGICGGFSFSGLVDDCKVPWVAVYQLWRAGDDMLMTFVGSLPVPGAPVTPAPAKPGAKPGLRLV